MEVTELPESAFAVYSKKFQQKKVSKPVPLVQNGVGKVHKKKNYLKNAKGLLEMNEIANILATLASKNRNEEVVQSLNNGNSNQITSSRTKKRSKTRQKLSEDVHRPSEDFVVHKGAGNISKTIKNKVPNIKITVSGAQNELPLGGKEKRGKKSVSFSKKGIKAKQSPSFEAKKSNKKRTSEETGFQLKTPSERNNTRSHKPVQKLDVNKIDQKLISKDWTNQENSIQTSKRLFEWLILPIKVRDFMRDFWEKQPLLIQREGSRNHYSELLSTPAIDAIFRENCISFTKHVDVTSYTNGVRETHNLSGRAQANVVWDFYSNGCSVRLLNPQAFVPRIHALNASLQEYFGCFVGANVYLTPPNSQGFAPHYDDIEAFVLQIEGKKRWKVYSPRNDKETLPRLSSPNFSAEEIGEPLLEVTLEPGDLLYFPRGFIHQASTVEGEHSLHITLSAYQKTAWVDLLEKTLPIALKRAAEEDVEFRRGLPLDYLGLEHHGNDQTKAQFVNGAMTLWSRLGHYLSLSLGAGVDQMGAQFMHDALPPVFTPEEKLGSGLGGGLKMRDNGSLKDRVVVVMETQIKLIRANICRLVEEENEVRLFHCLDNPLEYHAEEPQYLVLPDEGVSVITTLAQKYPAFVKVKNLPHDDEEALLTLVSDLWDAGLLLAKDMEPDSED